MTYQEQLHSAHVERLARLSRRAPDALPPRFRPVPRVILFRDGVRVRPPEPPRPLPQLPASLPAVPPLPTPALDRFTARQIVLAVAAAHGMSVAQLTDNTTRRHAVTCPRQMAYYLARVMTSLSYHQIAKAAGGFDHTTIMHGIAATARRMAADPAVADKVRSIRAALECQPDKGNDDDQPGR